MNIEANVAALALLATGANDLTQALDYIFEPDQEDNDNMRHPFVPYFPKPNQVDESVTENHDEEEKKNQPDDVPDELGDALNDLELGRLQSSNRPEDNMSGTECFICNRSQR